MAAVLKGDEWVPEPDLTWWNPDVLVTLETDAIGLVTGQETPDSILQAMDAAWKQGPS
jgi:raffinose/stachyose/melibiose transport system substrate-binding protein